MSQREIGRSGIPSHIGIARAVQRDARPYVVISTAAQVGTVDQRTATRIELGDESITAGKIVDLQRALRRKISRAGIACEVGVACAVYFYRPARVQATAAQVGTVD